MRQADETVEKIRLAGAFGTATVEQLAQEIDRLASPTGSEEVEGARPMRAEDIATLREAFAKRKAALSEQEKIAAAIEAEQRKIPVYERLKAQLAETERHIAAAQDQLDATQKRLELVRLRSGVGILRAPELIRIVDPPRDPEFPTRSSTIYLFAALAAGALLGLGLASITEFLDTSLRDPDEFSEVAGAPVVTRIGARKRNSVLSDQPESS